jgi:hypothetical protein
MDVLGTVETSLMDFPRDILHANHRTNGAGRRHGNDQGTAPTPDRPVSQGAAANLRGTVAACMAK